MIRDMAARTGAMHVARNRRKYLAKSGEQRVYESVLVRRTYRDGGKVRHETLANLSALPAEAVAAIEAALKGKRPVPAEQAVRITAAAPHGHVAAVHAVAVELGLPGLLGPAGRLRDLALALIISQVVAPASTRSTLKWWADVTLGADLGVADASTDDIYAAMEWLERRQDAIETELGRRHLGPAANPSRMALFDLSTRWLAGTQCLLAARGYSRDGRNGELQVECGLLTDPVGRPVAIRVFPGSTGDPAGFTAIAHQVRTKFGLAQLVVVGDCGMISSARVAALNRLNDGTRQMRPYGWITELRAPAIHKLMAGDGPLQLSPLGQRDLAETTSRDFPGERLVVGRNPILAADRARMREDALAATEQLLAPITAQVQAGRLAGSGSIGVEAGKVINTCNTGRHFTVTITETSLAVARKQDQIDAEAALDEFYVLRTPIPADELDVAAVVAAYQNLTFVERDFRHIKSGDLDLRPVFHRLAERVRGHVLIGMLACYLIWHLRRAWALLTCRDQDPPAQDNPAAPARHAAGAEAKASRPDDPAGPCHSFRGLLEHLATLTRNQVRYTGTQVTISVLTEPTSIQRQAFERLGAAIPLTLKQPEHHRPQPPKDQLNPGNCLPNRL
jgi:hypothetical protein